MTPDLRLTALLQAARDGDRAARDDLMPLVYDELRRIARQRLAGFRPGSVLSTTSLVHEAYVKLVEPTKVGWQDRAHFFALASRAMRFILVDYARARAAQKRGGGKGELPLEEIQIEAGAGGVSESERAFELLTLNRALDDLLGFSSRLAEIVEYRFFGGLTFEEIAETTGRSVPTVKRDWQRARAWLYRAMAQEGEVTAES